MESPLQSLGANQWLDKLRDPTHLRWALAGLALGLGYFGIHWPCNEYSLTLTRQLANEKSRARLVEQVIGLRKELKSFEDHVPNHPADATEWRQGVLSALRNSKLVLISLEPDKVQRLGPYELQILRLELEGNYHELDKFLEWIENDPRLRIDALSVSPDKTTGATLLFQMNLTGILG